MTKECNICISNITTLNKRVICPYCNMEACRKCTKKYLLSSVNQPHCMNCKKSWNDEFCIDVLTKDFMEGKYKRHHIDLLISKEKSKLPLTQAKIEKEKEYEELQDEINKLQSKIYKLKQQQKELKTGQSEEKRQFIRGCPSINCKGFLSTRWKCGLCDCNVCSKCHEIKNDNHECKKENVETAELLKKDTKPCPKCASMIFKIEGCDQMFCTRCHTAFSWKTSKIETKIIHNPHYYEWQRKQNNGIVPRQPGDVVCGGRPNINDITRKMDDEDVKYITEVFRYNIHIENIILDHNNNDEDDNEDLRFRYLKNDIDEERWRKLLAQREKKELKMKEYKQVMQMYSTVINDLLLQMSRMNSKEKKKTIKEIEKLKEYTNEQIDRVKKKYKSKAVKTMPYV